jgi:hypothetical protein
VHHVILLTKQQTYASTLFAKKQLDCCSGVVASFPKPKVAARDKAAPYPLKNTGHRMPLVHCLPDFEQLHFFSIALALHQSMDPMCGKKASYCPLDARSSLPILPFLMHHCPLLPRRNSLLAELVDELLKSFEHDVHSLILTHAVEPTLEHEV